MALMGLEPIRIFIRQILSLLRLPIPPQRRTRYRVVSISRYHIFTKGFLKKRNRVSNDLFLFALHSSFLRNLFDEFS